jgi:D-glycero-D-manno-heptose 1,7-bisphosphate phosphatase
MHQKLDSMLAEVGGHIDALVYCPHTPDDGCDCRKPAPGLLRQISEQLGVELAGVPVVGDSLRDLQSAQAVGARPILVRTGKGERSLPQLADDASLANVPVYADLAAAVDALLAGAVNQSLDS